MARTHTHACLTTLHPLTSYHLHLHLQLHSLDIDYAAHIAQLLFFIQLNFVWQMKFNANFIMTGCRICVPINQFDLFGAQKREAERDVVLFWLVATCQRTIVYFIWYWHDFSHQFTDNRWTFYSCFPALNMSLDIQLVFYFRFTFEFCISRSTDKKWLSMFFTEYMKFVSVEWLLLS